MTSYSRLPYHMQDAARCYVEHGIKPGSFLSAVLANNLVRSFEYADDVNLGWMYDWAYWLHNELPIEAWGSEAAVTEWCNAGGRLGKIKNHLEDCKKHLELARARYAKHGLSEDAEAIEFYLRQIAHFSETGQ